MLKFIFCYDKKVLSVVSVFAVAVPAVHALPVKEVTGVHDIYFVFKGADAPLFNFKWWKYNK